MAEAAILGFLQNNESIPDSGNFAAELNLDHEEVKNVIKSLQGFRYIEAKVHTDLCAVGVCWLMYNHCCNVLMRRSWNGKRWFWLMKGRSTRRRGRRSFTFSRLFLRKVAYPRMISRCDWLLMLVWFFLILFYLVSIRFSFCFRKSWMLLYSKLEARKLLKRSGWQWGSKSLGRYWIVNWLGFCCVDSSNELSLLLFFLL